MLVKARYKGETRLHQAYVAACFVVYFNRTTRVRHSVATAAHRRARIMAVTRGQVLVLTIDSANLVIRPRGQASALWAEVGPAAAHVALERGDSLVAERRTCSCSHLVLTQRQLDEVARDRQSECREQQQEGERVDG